MVKSPHILPLLLLLLTAAAGCGGEAVTPDREQLPGLDGERINNFYTNEEIAYLLEIGLWRDTTKGAHVLRRWVGDVVVGTKGSPTPDDLEALRAAAAELDGLAREISVGVDFSDTARPNVTVYFIPRGAFGSIEPGYPYPEFGFAALPSTSGLHAASILVATDSTTQRGREGLIYHGLAAALGLGNSSPSYPESIFYDGRGEFPDPAFSPIDRAIVEILYSSGMWAGMTREEAIRLLANRE